MHLLSKKYQVCRNIDVVRIYFVALIQKIVVACVVIAIASYKVNGQKIVVDTTSTNKYIIKKSDSPPSNVATAEKEEISFSDRAISIGTGILNRLKARLNLEEAAESIKAKKERLIGTKPEVEDGDN